MQKILFGIFAHPDDEAFGPAATLLKEVSEGTELHLIVLTGGEGGANPDNLPDLGAARLQEWRAAGTLIGASSMHHLGYVDGTLNNITHLEITDKLSSIVHNVIGERNDVAIEFMGLDLNGYTGHIDHIVASRSACLAFYRLRDQGLAMTRVRLACLPKEQVPAIKTDFVFAETGRTPDEITETVDGREFSEKIHEIMQQHHTQRSDYDYTKDLKGSNWGIDHFIVLD